MYCFDCKLSFCKLGEDRIPQALPDRDWHAYCPKCKGLGRGACKFTWAQDPDKALQALKDLRQYDDEVVVDEYGQRFTASQFQEMLDEQCPIWYTSMIGRKFQ